MRLSHTVRAELTRAPHQERESGLSQERESCLSHDERVAACPVRTRRKPRRTQLAPLFRSPGFSRSGGSGEVCITRAWYSAFFMRTVLHQRAARSTRQPWLQTTDLMREVRGSTHRFLVSFTSEDLLSIARARRMWLCLSARALFVVFILDIDRKVSSTSHARVRVGCETVRCSHAPV